MKNADCAPKTLDFSQSLMIRCSVQNASTKKSQILQKAESSKCEWLLPEKAASFYFCPGIYCTYDFEAIAVICGYLSTYPRKSLHALGLRPACPSFHFTRNSLLRANQLSCTRSKVLNSPLLTSLKGAVDCHLVKSAQ